MQKKIFRWSKVLILLYCIVGIAVYYAQDRLIWHPRSIDKSTPYHFSQGFRELNLNYDSASNLNIVQFRANLSPGDSLSKGVVLYFHGNSETIADCAPIAGQFTGRGYEIWMIDYPGYGKSTGPLTEQRLYDYALIVYKLARTHYQPGNIILYGRSIGTGVAAQLAAVRDCRRLILESPYFSMTSLARHYLPVYPMGKMLHYRFPTNEYLSAVTAPVTIFHGSSDRLIPYSNAIRLQPLLKPGDAFITIPGAGHNDLGQDSFFREQLDSLLSR